MNIFEALNKYFGYSTFRQGQQEIIEAILKGENAVAVLPTGAGKSICFQVPALVSEGFSIVVSPLIALMKDQVDSLNKNENISAYINSTMNFSETEIVLQRISYGKIKILYVSPERLEVLNFAERIKKLNPAFLFVDEAHCISEWGHNFRPSYAKIREFVSFAGIKRISAFTATATPEVVKDIVSQLGLQRYKLFVKGFERENLALNVIPTKNKKADTLHLLKTNPGAAIIYTASRKQAEEITGFLNLSKIPCEFYHAGVNPLIRRKIQDDFINSSLRVIAATNAFGMGIDKKDIRTIIHYNIPGSIENYYQEIGRAGRDGNESAAYLLFDDKDIDIQNYFIENSHPDKIFIQRIYELICDYGKVGEGKLPDREIAVNMEFLSAVMQKEISRGLLHSALRILEAGGFLRVLSEFDKKTSVLILLDKVQLRGVLKRSLNPLLKDLLIILVREFGESIFVKRVYIDFNSLSQKSSLPAQEIDTALEELNSMGLISYQKVTGKENIILTKPRIDSKKLNLDYKRINENYLRFQNKLQQMVDFIFINECRFRYILNYFGEDTSEYKCGKCDKCVTVERTTGATVIYLKELILRTLDASVDILNETSLIKIMAGTEKSPALQNIETFGSASNFTRNEIKSALAELISSKFIERNRINNKYLQVGLKGKEFLDSNETNEKIVVNDYSIELELFNLLREVRSKAVKKFVQPPYIICPDEVLRSIANKKPKDKTQLMRITGFNERMFNKIGHDVLTTIMDFQKAPPEKMSVENVKNSTLPKSIKETYNLILRKYSLKDIAALQKLSEAVVSMQIETILEYYPETNITSLSSPEEIKLITDKLEAGCTDLKELKNSLPPEISYALIRTLAAKSRVKKKVSVSGFQYEL